MSTLLTICTLDGNSHIFPLAFAIVDLENDGLWYWFLRNLKATFGEPNDLVIVFDGHKSIGKGVSSIYDSAEHGLCAFICIRTLKRTISQV